MPNTMSSLAAQSMDGKVLYLPGNALPCGTSRWLKLALLLSLSCVCGAVDAYARPSKVPAAQAPAGAATSSALGTVKEIAGTTLTLTLENGQTMTVDAPDAARVVQLTPGSTNLKAATPSSLKNIAVGDRVLVRGAAGATTGSLNASLVVLMKQEDIQQKQAQDLADWQKRGTGGLVSSVDRSANTIAISTVTAAGPGKMLVEVTPKTVFRRYASDSVKFEDARTSAFADLQPGDQLRVRGEKSADGTTLQAEEIVSGSFLNIAGTISSIDAAANTMTLKDLATKKTVTVNVTPNSSLHKLPPQMAAMFARRLHGEAASDPAGAASSGSVSGAAGPRAASSGAGARGPGQASRSNITGRATGSAFAHDGGAGKGRATGAGAGISQAIAQSPVVTLAELRSGDAVMIVATPISPAPTAVSTTAPTAMESVTAITVLAGVEPILAATPKNSQPMSLSAWTIGGDIPSE
ncbi:MAG: DUF5666 domain-containing protein [Acidobacteriaceae bacterium]